MISRITDILINLLLSAVVFTAVLLYLGDDQYYLILAIVLLVLVNTIYIWLKLRGMRKPPPPPSSESSSGTPIKSLSALSCGAG